jgi:ribonuclease-3
MESLSRSESPEEGIPLLALLQQSLGYQFRNPGLLSLALSTLKQPVSPETAAARQRLEFLGDAAWNFAVALATYRAEPLATAGDLTRLRAAWSSRAGLARLAKGIGLPSPPSPPPHGPSQRVLAELLESVLGAMVDDGGFEAIRALANRVISEAIADVGRSAVDAKSELQIWSLRRGKLPVYRLIERWGPPHHPTFRVRVTIPDPEGEIHVQAEGGSRQAAEKEAARLALEKIRRIL